MKIGYLFQVAYFHLLVSNPQLLFTVYAQWNSDNTARFGPAHARTPVTSAIIMISIRGADGIFELGGTKLSANDFNSIRYFCIIWALTSAQVVTFVIAYGLMVCTKKPLENSYLKSWINNSEHC